jgi:hypothetical protein
MMHTTQRRKPSIILTIRNKLVGTLILAFSFRAAVRLLPRKLLLHICTVPFIQISFHSCLKSILGATQCSSDIALTQASYLSVLFLLPNHQDISLHFWRLLVMGTKSVDFVQHLVFWNNTMSQTKSISVPRWDGEKNIQSLDHVYQSPTSM